MGRTPTYDRFAVDHNMQTCFTNGGNFLPPEQHTGELMGKVAEFFETAMKLPLFLP